MDKRFKHENFTTTYTFNNDINTLLLLTIPYNLSNIIQIKMHKNQLPHETIPPFSTLLALPTFPIFWKYALSFISESRVVSSQLLMND